LNGSASQSNCSSARSDHPVRHVRHRCLNTGGPWGTT
jgi:hypothetical protein